MKTNKLFSVATILLLASGSLIAESLPLQSVNKAGAVIDAAIEAHGGEAISNLNTLVQKADFTTFATGQSRKPGPPYDKGWTANFNAIDLENDIFVARNKGAGGGYDFDQGELAAQLPLRYGCTAG